jgi:CRAL/TRIO domain
MFPELLGQMFIINTPGLFNMIWKVFAPLLDSRTTDKIKIYSKPKDWQPALLQLIDADVLPPGEQRLCSTCYTHKTVCKVLCTYCVAVYTATYSVAEK